jgi:hypothetical protein
MLMKDILISILVAFTITTATTINAQAGTPTPTIATTVIEKDGGSGITPPIFCVWRQGIRVCTKRKPAPKIIPKTPLKNR